MPMATPPGCEYSPPDWCLLGVRPGGERGQGGDRRTGRVDRKGGQEGRTGWIQTTGQRDREKVTGRKEHTSIGLTFTHCVQGVPDIHADPGLYIAIRITIIGTASFGLPYLDFGSQYSNVVLFWKTFSQVSMVGTKRKEG